MYTYTLYENNEAVYSTESLDNAMHELLCLIRNYMVFIKSHGLSLGKKKLDNPYISSAITNLDPKKRYNIITENIYFSLNDYSFHTDLGNIFVYYDTLHTRLINELKNLQNVPFDNIKVVSDNTKIIQNKIGTTKSVTNNKLTLIPSKLNNEQTDEKLTTKNITELITDTTKILTDVQKNIELNTKSINVTDIMPCTDAMPCTVSTKQTETGSIIPNTQTKPEEIINSDNIELEEFEKQIKLLEDIKKQEEEKIKKIRETHNNEKGEYLDYSCEVNGEKMLDRINNERLNEKRRIFDHDKRLFITLYDEIKAGERSEDNIPVLFKQKYPILKFMNDIDHLDTDNDFESYTELFNEIYPVILEEDTPYVPHNYNYLNTDTKNKYLEFIKLNKGTLKSLDDILLELNKEEHKDNAIKSNKIFKDNSEEYRKNFSECKTMKCEDTSNLLKKVSKIISQEMNQKN